MPTENTLYYDSSGKKFKLYVDGNYRTFGAVHLDASNAEYNNGIYSIMFDSAYDITLDPYTPMLSLTGYDSDTNPIIWTVTRQNDHTPTSINPNFLGSVEKTISKLIGAGTSYTITPIMTFADSHTTDLELEASDLYKVTGKISTGVGKNGLPKSANLDSSDFFDKEFRFFLDYNAKMINITDVNTTEFLKYVGLGSPDVKYKSTAPKRPLGTNAQGMVFNDVDSSMSGKKFFVVNNSYSGRTVDQYNLTDSYEITQLLTTTTPDKSLSIYNNLGISNSPTEGINTSNLYGLDFNDSGNRLFLADRGHNNIYQYNLTNPYELDSFAIYETDYFENSNVNSPAQPSQNANRNIRNYTWQWWWGQSVPIWRPPNDIYDEANTTHLSKDGKHYYMMDINGIRQFDLLVPNVLNSFKTYKGQFTILESSEKVVTFGPSWYYYPVWKGAYITTSSDNSIITQKFQEYKVKTGSTSRMNFSVFPQYRQAGHTSYSPYGFTVSGVFYRTGWAERRYFIHSAYPQCFTLSDDGTKLYIVWGCAYNEGKIKQYTLTNPYDITSISSFDHDISHGIGSKSPDMDNVTESKLYGAWGIQFKPDGTSLFVWDNDTNYVYEFSVPIPYDISSIPTVSGVIQPWSESYKNRSSQISSSSKLKHFKMNRNGTKFYLSNSSLTRQYSMSTAYDISTAIFDVERSSLGIADVSNGSGFEMNDSETTIYLPEPIKDRISSFKLTASSSANNDSADLNSAVTIHNKKFLNLDSYISSSSISDVLLTSDGKQIYISENSTNKIHRYNLLDSNELYSAVYDSSFSTGFSGLSGMVLNDSENVMIVSGGTSANGFVREYTITNPLSGSTFNSNEFLLTGTYNASITDVHFKNDGSEFITLGDNGGLDLYTTRNNFVVRPI
ncbi:MAG: hypothetical protein CMA53_03115 [Euryarchaeota archaeon]|nr:hypothetical protein [Euryarchaeota archaeon]